MLGGFSPLLLPGINKVMQLHSASMTVRNNQNPGLLLFFLIDCFSFTSTRADQGRRSQTAVSHELFHRRQEWIKCNTRALIRARVKHFPKNPPRRHISPSFTSFGKKRLPRGAPLRVDRRRKNTSGVRSLSRSEKKKQPRIVMDTA